MNDELKTAYLSFIVPRSSFMVFFAGYGVTQASESWALVAKVQFFLPGPNSFTRGLQVLRAAHLSCKQEGGVRVPGIPPNMYAGR